MNPEKEKIVNKGSKKSKEGQQDDHEESLKALQQKSYGQSIMSIIRKQKNRQLM
jgi:hypothetical protein